MSHGNDRNPNARTLEECGRRTISSFIVWCREQRQRMARENPKTLNTKTSKQLADEWNSLSEEEKQPFKVEAKRFRVLHKKECPNYKFRTRRKPTSVWNKDKLTSPMYRIPIGVPCYPFVYYQLPYSSSSSPAITSPTGKRNPLALKASKDDPMVDTSAKYSEVMPWVQAEVGSSRGPLPNGRYPLGQYSWSRYPPSYVHWTTPYVYCPLAHVLVPLGDFLKIYR